MRSMQRFKVRPTPEHYSVWYRYHEGGDPALSRQVDFLTSRGLGPDAGAWNDLFSKFVLPRIALRVEPATNGEAPSAEGAATAEKLATHRVAQAQASELSGAIDKVLGEVLGQVRAAGQGITAYGASLDDASERMAEADADLPGIVAVLAAETQRMRESNRSLEMRLKTSSDEIATLRRNLEESQREAETDGLTGIANRRAFDGFLRRAMAQSQDDRPLALCMMDIDHFKKFNDTYGHPLGDQVLKLVARILTDCVREGDLPARYGGEEFAIVLPGADSAMAVEIADRVRETLAKRTIKRRDSGEVLGGITLSAGVAVHHPGEQAGTMIERADAALYAAKRGGRNRVVDAEAPA